MTRETVVRRVPFFASAELERIEDAALRILAEIGIRVGEKEAFDRLVRAGHRASGDRILIDRPVAARWIAEERDRNGRRPPDAQEPPETGPIRLEVSQYPLNVHEPGTDRIVPFTTAALARATRLLDVLADRGVATSPAGAPADVPAPIQSVAAYWAAATYARTGRAPVDPKNEEAVPFVFAMAEALGSPVTSLPVYLFSPLALEGESLRIALRHRGRLAGVSVNGMPAAGQTAPIHLADAFALSAAETIGCALLVRGRS